MSTVIVPTKLQTMQVGITGPDGANTLIIVSGMANCALHVQTPPVAGIADTQQGSHSMLLDPVLSRGQFHRAIATAALASIHFDQVEPAERVNFGTVLESVEAHWDDDSGKIEVRFDVAANVVGGGSHAIVAWISFQVMTLAAL